jgi:hypothetical protein
MGVCECPGCGEGGRVDVSERMKVSFSKWNELSFDLSRAAVYSSDISDGSMRYRLCVLGVSGLRLLRELSD